jgi:KUP system potassium uptake protein
VFVAANSGKLLEGGWFPIALAGGLAVLMLTWRKGWLLLESQRAKLRQSEEEFEELPEVPANLVDLIQRELPRIYATE